MKLSNLIFALIILSVQQTLAYQYKITCADKKLISFENSEVDQSSSECKAFIANGFLKCFDSKKINQSSEMITLSTPNDHYYQNKESTRYSRQKIQAIIDSAIRAGNDPYLTLSIVITENPPTVNLNKGSLSSSETYAESYGTIPLDAIAVGDTMACERVQTGYGNGLMKLKNSKRLKRITVDPQGVEKTVCIVSQFTAGEGANFYVVDARGPDDCCMKIKASRSSFKTNPEDKTDVTLDAPLRAKVLDVIAQNYMLNRFAAAQTRAYQERLPQRKVAMVVQSYNGYGQFGSSEAMNNRCLHKIKMGKSPVYGAGTSEIMLNSLMNNSEIESMVAESLKKNKKDHVVSQLCAAYGSGSHKIDGYVFTSLLETFIGERKTCPEYSNKLKKLNKYKLAKSSAPKMAVPVQASDVYESSGPGSDVKNSNPAGIAK